VCRARCNDRWILSVVLVMLVPPCGCVSVLCLALAQRSRRTSGGDTATSACLERISDAAVILAFCFLLAANFFAKHLYRAHLVSFLESSNCSAEVSSNSTLWTVTVGSYPSQSQSPVRIDDRAIKRRFELNTDLPVLQSPVKVEVESVLRRNVNFLPVHRRHAVSSPKTTEPWPTSLLSSLHHYNHIIIIIVVILFRPNWLNSWDKLSVELV